MRKSVVFVLPLTVMLLASCAPDSFQDAMDFDTAINNIQNRIDNPTKTYDELHIVHSSLNKQVKKAPNGKTDETSLTSREIVDVNEKAIRTRNEDVATTKNSIHDEPYFDKDNKNKDEILSFNEEKNDVSYFVTTNHSIQAPGDISTGRSKAYFVLSKSGADDKLMSDALLNTKELLEDRLTAIEVFGQENLDQIKTLEKNIEGFDIRLEAFSGYGKEAYIVEYEGVGEQTSFRYSWVYQEGYVVKKTETHYEKETEEDGTIIIKERNSSVEVMYESDWIRVPTNPDPNKWSVIALEDVDDKLPLLQKVLTPRPEVPENNE